MSSLPLALAFLGNKRKNKFLLAAKNSVDAAMLLVLFS
jgi:hypothetical protein